MAKRRWKYVEIKKESGHGTSAEARHTTIFLFGVPLFKNTETYYKVTVTDAETGQRVIGEGKTIEEAWKDLERKL
jgi:hypothetical protein